MDRELFEKLQQEATALQDKVDKLRDIERLMDEMGMNSGYNLYRRLEDIGFDLNQSLRTLSQDKEVVSDDVLIAANFSATNEMTKKDYVTSSITSLYIDCMANLVDIDNQVNAGTLSCFEAMKQLKAIVQSVAPYSTNIPNMKNENLKEMAKSFNGLVRDSYAKYQKELTPEQKQTVIATKVESINIKTDPDMESVIDENDRLQKQTLDMKESSKGESQFDSVATEVLEKFKRLNSALEVTSYGGSINFDPDEVSFVLRALQDSVFDLNAIANNPNNSRDTQYTRYLSDMSVVFSEKTKKTRSALADFQTGTFESSIPQIRKLIEETKSQDEKSEILKRFTKNAAWYMQVALMNQGQNSSHVDQVMKEVDDIIRSANSIAVQHEREAVEFERKQTKDVTAEMRRQVKETVIEQIQNSAVGSTMTQKEIEEKAEQITDETMEDSSVQAATAEAVAEAVESVQEEVVKSAKEVVKDIVEDTVEETVQAVVEDIVTEQVATIEAKNTAEQTQEKPLEQALKLERIDMFNTPVEKTREEVAEDVKWNIMGSMVESMLSDTARFKDIDSNIVKSISSTFKIMSNDEGRVITMTDGSKQSVQTVLRKSFMDRISGAELLEQISDKENLELNDIIAYYDVAQQSLSKNFVAEAMVQITTKDSSSFKSIVDAVMPESSSTKTFDSMNSYLKDISDFMPYDFGQDLLYNMVGGSNGYYSTFDDMYQQIHSRMETFQNSRNGNTTSNETMTQVTPKVDPSTINIPGIEPVSMPNPSVDFSNSMPSVDNIMDTNTTTKHPLDKYRELLEKYDIQFITDTNFPAGRFVALDRTTNQPPQYRSREERDTLIRDLSFAKSWVSSCSTDLSKSGGMNEYGIDPRQWEYSFNDGAQATFDWVVDALKNNSGPNLSQKVIDYVTQNSNYKYANSIVDSLLRDRNNKELLNNIHTVLLNEAGISSTINQSSQELDRDL